MKTRLLASVVLLMALAKLVGCVEVGYQPRSSNVARIRATNPGEDFGRPTTLWINSIDDQELPGARGSGAESAPEVGVTAYLRDLTTGKIVGGPAVGTIGRL